METIGVHFSSILRNYQRVIVWGHAGLSALHKMRGLCSAV